MGWLGLDDTDSLAGGCTTKTMEELILNLPKNVQVGTVRLVRLWPFASGRTRGNAALAVELQCEDEEFLIAHLNSWWMNELSSLKGLISPSHHSDRPQVPSDPGMVWFDSQPDELHYWSAVQHHVAIDDVPPATKSWGGAGVIGATAAVAWPGRTSTWEAIAWRHTSDGSKPRRVCLESLEEIDSWPGTFMSRDPRSGTSLIAPRGHSPVLCGVRAKTELEASKALAHVLSSQHTERSAGFRTFMTNQATGDHLQPATRAVVEEIEVHSQRKHARIQTSDGIWVSFGEGGPVNQLSRWLKNGDIVEMKGLKSDDGTFHLEQLRVISWNARNKQRPLCSVCNVRMKSMGRDQGVRCPKCKLRQDDTWDDVPSEPPFLDWVEPPVSSRRHLARPLDFD